MVTHIRAPPTALHGLILKPEDFRIIQVEARQEQMKDLQKFQYQGASN